MTKEKFVVWHDQKGVRKEIKLPERIKASDPNTMDLTGLDFDTVNMLMNSEEDFTYDYDDKTGWWIRKEIEEKA